jgi:CBS-domain-containing membrane protein
MNVEPIYSHEFEALQDSDTVGDATQRMLEHRVSDLPVVDADGKLIGMFKLDRLLAGLLPTAVIVGYGVPDLTFLGDGIEELRHRMRELVTRAVRDFAVKPDHVAYPDTSPFEVVLHLYRGTNNVPVLSRDDGKLVGMVSARDVLAALTR